MPRYLSYIKDGKRIMVHREIWEKAHGPIPKNCDIHHLNGDGTDNRLENLVCLTRSEHVKLHQELKKRGEEVVNSDDPEVISDREYSRTWALNNPEKVRAKNRKYYHAHLEEMHLKSKLRREKEDKAKIAAYQRQYHIEHRDADIAYLRQYRLDNAAELQAKYLEKYRKLGVVIRARRSLRRFERVGASADKIESAEVRLASAEMLAFYEKLNC